MDPFVNIKVREQTFKTQTKNNAGKKPVWNEHFDIDVKYVGDDMWIQVCDQDTMSFDVVGETTIKLSALCSGAITDEWFPIQYKGKESGKIHLKGVFSSNSLIDKMAGSMNQMVNMNMQPMHYQQPQMMQPQLYPQVPQAYNPQMY